jgi:CheY-like chemotaxis protein
MKRILCINDNELTLFIQKQVLSKSGLSEEVITAINGKSGLDYCKKLIHDNKGESDNYPGLIFLDLYMPVMDGLEFLHHYSTEIWPYFKNTGIIITSYSVDESDRERAKQYPFVIDFLTTSLSTAYLQSLPVSTFSYS